MLIRDINKFGNNVMTQQLFLTLGAADGEPGNPARGASAVRGLLATRGWPADTADQTAPTRAAFIDLLQSATSHASVATFTLEDDALVDRSPLIDAAPRAGLTSVPLAAPHSAVFTREALATRPVAALCSTRRIS